MTFEINPWEYIAHDYYGGSILLGNGASMAISRQFGYGSLLSHVSTMNLLDADMRRLFNVFETQDFELVLRRVWQASIVNQSLQISDNRTYQAYRNIRNSLIQVIQDIHPKYEDIQHHLPNMAQFLKHFKKIFSLNYDLLVYWAVIYGNDANRRHRFTDCFIDREFDDDWGKFGTTYRRRESTMVLYPHGNLILCRDIVDQEYKIHVNQSYNLLNEILDSWDSESYIPLFVSEGTVSQKITAIQNSYYLSTVYREILTCPQESLTIFGWGLGTQDHHILRQMSYANIDRVAVSVFNKDQDYCLHAHQTIRKELGSHIKIDFFDSNSHGCWINGIPD